MIKIRLHYSIVLLLLAILTGCKETNTFTIEGEFHKNDPSPVKLYKLGEKHSELIDSVYSDSIYFKLEGIAEYTNLYLVKYFNDQEIYLIIRPKDRIEISIDNTLPEISYYVSNSPDSKFAKEIIDKQTFVRKQIHQLSIEWEANRGDSLVRMKIDKNYQALLTDHKEYTRNFIYDHPGSLANILAIYQNFGRKGQALFDRYDDIDIFNFVDSNLTKLYPNTDAVIVLNNELNETKEQIRQKTLIEKEVKIGYPIPKFSATTIAGDTINLAETDNKALIVFFWASWNSYSIKELFQLNNYFSQLNEWEKKLQVVTISLDSSPEKLNDFILANNIILPVICDYNYWNSNYTAQYAIKRIPTVISTNSEGFVNNRDITAEELINQLNDYLK